MSKVFIVIDGGNFYHKLKSKEIRLHNLLEFDYKEFIRWLAKKNKIVDCCYYVGQIRYVGFDFNPSFAMIRFSDSRTLLKKEDLLSFKTIKKNKFYVKY